MVTLGNTIPGDISLTGLGLWLGGAIEMDRHRVFPDHDWVPVGLVLVIHSSYTRSTEHGLGMAWLVRFLRVGGAYCHGSPFLAVVRAGHSIGKRFVCRIFQSILAWLSSLNLKLSK